MKILYLIPRFTTGGAEKLVLQYAKHFKDVGFDVAVASVVGGGELTKEFEQAGIKIHVSHKKTLGSWRKLKKFYKKFAPDLIHSHVFSADLAAYLLVRKKTRWISTQHNVEFAASGFRKFIWKRILKKADKVIAVSENVKKYNEEIFKLSDIKLIRNGVEIDKWLKVSKNNLSDDILHLATIGRLEDQKGHTYLIQALSQLKNYDWQWHIYGEGKLESKLKKEIKKYGLEARVIWYGVVSDMVKEYKNINLVVQPSLWEGLSLVAMEAMAAGKVLVGTPWVVETLVENKKTGLVVKEKDVDSLVEVLKYVFENKKDLENMSEQARKHAKDNFSLEKNIKEVEEIYKKYV